MPEKKLFKNMDFVILAIAVFLMLFGLLMISSATSSPFSVGEVQKAFVKHQGMWIGLGVLAIALIVYVDYGMLLSIWPFIYFLNVALLFSVLIIGTSAYGAQSWIPLGPFRLQPSELAKIFTIISLAGYLSKKEGKFERWFDFIPPALHIGFPLVLILLQPDLGTAMVFVAVYFGMCYIAGAPLQRLLILGGGALSAIVIAILLHVHFGVPLPGVKEYQLKRLLVFIDPSIDPLHAGYQMRQSLIAVGSGRYLGKGLYLGAQNQLQFLPERHTDFIFSVIGEELGFLGCSVILVLYMVLIMRMLRVVLTAKDVFGSSLAAGIVSMLSFHVLVNVGMAIGIMPITGIPLPFISYGGSSLLANCMGIGLVLSVHMRRHKILF